MINVILINGITREIKEVQIAQGYSEVQKLVGTDRWTSTYLFDSDRYLSPDVVFHPEEHGVVHSDFTISGMAIKGNAVVARIGAYGIIESPAATIDDVTQAVHWVEQEKHVNPDPEWHWPKGAL